MIKASAIKSQQQNLILSQAYSADVPKHHSVCYLCSTTVEILSALYIDSDPAASIVSGQGNKVARSIVWNTHLKKQVTREPNWHRLCCLSRWHTSLYNTLPWVPMRQIYSCRGDASPLQLLGQHSSVGKGIQCNQWNKTEHWPELWRINRKAAGNHSPTTSSNLLSDGRIQRNLTG